MTCENKTCNLKNDCKEGKVSKTKNALLHIKANQNVLQPIIESLQNSIEAFAKSISIFVKISSIEELYNDKDVKKTINNINLIIEDDGEGFDLTSKDGNKFGRFGDWLNDSKNSGHNKGCGRAQFLHYFNDVVVYSKNKDTKEKFTWTFDREKDIEDKTKDIKNNYNITRIEMNNCFKIKEFYEKIIDLKQLKQDLCISCLLSLIDKYDLVINLQLAENGKIIQEDKIIQNDIKKIINNNRTNTLRIKYNKVDFSKAVEGEFDFVGDENKTEELQINEYKIFDNNFQNQVYLCANNQIIQNITNDVRLPKNFSISNKDNNNFRLLYLVKSDFLDKKCVNREGFNFDNKNEIQKKIKKQIKECKNKDLFQNEYYIFEENITQTISNDIHITYKQIKEQIDSYYNEIDEEMKKVGISEQTRNEYKNKNILNKSTQDIIEEAGEKDGKNNILKQQQIIKKYKELLTADIQRGGKEKEVKTIESKQFQVNKDARNQLAQEISELVNEANKQELTNYVIRRQLACELLKHYNSKISNKEEVYNEDYFHNLIIPMGTTENDNVENNLWMLNEDYSHYTHYSSNVNLKDVQYNEEKIFTEDIDEEFLKLCNETINTNKQQENIKINKPDVLIFNDLRHFIIIDFKRPDVDCCNYVNKITEYAELLANKLKNRKEDLKFYCYLIGDNIGRGTGLNPLDVGILPEGKSENGEEGWYRDNITIKLQTTKKPIKELGTAYVEILKYNQIQQIATLRNKQFIDKLNLEDIVKKVVKEILKNKQN